VCVVRVCVSFVVRTCRVASKYARGPTRLTKHTHHKQTNKAPSPRAPSSPPPPTAPPPTRRRPPPTTCPARRSSCPSIRCKTARTT
jgi:hypothetical protein